MISCKNHIYTVLSIIILLGVAFLLYESNVNVKKYSIFLSQADAAPIEFQYGEEIKFADKDFYQQIEKKLITENADFISADLTRLRLRLYKQGKIVEDIPILSKGLEGSWWETPSGLFSVRSKKENHFSSFGNVYMPFSIQFQGNFFIHGWPYHPNGTPVQQSFSGGCIRLSTENAKKIYQQTEINMPILIHERKEKKDTFMYPTMPPKLTASSFLVADIENNFVIADKSPNKLLPIASITKLMTALIATEYLNIERILPVSNNALVYTSKPRLKTGDSISVYNLLYPLLRESSNEAAIVFAESIKQKNFIGFMNQKAVSIGMENTMFTDTSGSNSTNVSTAKDLFRFAKYLHNNRNFVLNITKGNLELERVYGKLIYNDLENHNLYHTYKTFLGGKVGKTRVAGETMLAIFEIPIRNTRRTIAIVVLHSKDVKKDIDILLQHLADKYHTRIY